MHPLITDPTLAMSQWPFTAEDITVSAALLLAYAREILSALRR